jgi:polysaccharide biosynthesis protein PslG
MSQLPDPRGESLSKLRRSLATAAALPTVIAATLSMAPLVTNPAAAPARISAVLAATRTPTIPVNRTRGGPSVGKGLFGMHIIHSSTRWPRTAGGAALPVGFERIWDDKATWLDIQPNAPTEWIWTRLDQQVATARSHRAYVEVTLGQTPQWALDPTNATETGDWYGPGAASPPAKDLSSGTYKTWQTYVGAVAQRYAGKVGAYEVWNEPDWTKSFSGTTGQLVELTKEARSAIKAKDPNALIVSPSFVVSAPDDLKRIGWFLNQGGAKYIDVLAVHAYATPRAQPEAVAGYMSKIRALLSNHGVHKPIWNTEYTVGRASGPRYSASVGGGLLARSYLLSPWMRLSRLAWYAWDDHGFGGVWLTSRSGWPTGVAADYKRIASWMIGKRERSCAHRGAVWGCSFRYGTSVFLAAWSGGGTTAAIVPNGFHHMTTLSGSRSRVTPGRAIKLGARPVWLTA